MGNYQNDNAFIVFLVYMNACVDFHSTIADLMTLLTKITQLVIIHIPAPEAKTNNTITFSAWKRFFRQRKIDDARKNEGKLHSLIMA